MCSYHGDDWAGLLLMMEFAHMGLVQSSHGLTPYTGRKLPNLLFDGVSESLGKRKPSEVPVQAPTARKTHGPTHIRFAVLDLEYGFENVELKFCRERQETIDLARENLLQAQRRQKEYYDKKRVHVKFKVGDFVRLATRDLPLHHAQLDGSERPKLSIWSSGMA
ncbi:Aste57867_2186 [Aphanomyces stellatus]|uniref:Aste57867_2186 protein n=1 Tax=Aphanomyces stellatus TaxID=120398 RepID=A0A485K821_9STRA|nr:hypothetical protein As57867_002181 [Aphanomyces stellatus]VFT79389.1 Aste57867_2186 [Aphanomyces stellatus]